MDKVTGSLLDEVASAAADQLHEVIFPFWLTRGIDDEHGGFFTCFDNRGRQRVSTDKYTWSQGRFVWLLSRAARLADQGLLRVDGAQLRATALRGAEFLVDHAVNGDGTCVYLIDRVGARVPGSDERSVYADLFVAMGLYELAHTLGDPSWLKPADDILTRATDDIVSRTAPTPPYPLPAAHTAFGPLMILANVCLERHRAILGLDLDSVASGKDLGQAVQRMLAHRQPDGTFLEMIPDPGQPVDSLAVRHRVPGHAIEGLWVALEAADLIAGIDTAPLLHSLDALCASAWDTEQGGLFRFVDGITGGRPEGADPEAGYDRLVQRTWDTKLWWVHSESAFTTALAAQRHDDQQAAEWCRQIWDYTLATFPGDSSGPGESEGEEWVQIRDRSGRPLDEVVALPVKDPFHISRNLMQLVELQARRS